MIQPTPRSTHAQTLFPYTTLFRSTEDKPDKQQNKKPKNKIEKSTPPVKVDETIPTKEIKDSSPTPNNSEESKSSLDNEIVPEDPEIYKHDCLICNQKINIYDMIVLNCLHKFHHKCIQKNSIKVCPIEKCYRRLTMQEKAAVMSKIEPRIEKMCEICKKMIYDVKHEAAIHCPDTKEKMHASCFMAKIEEETEGKILMTQQERKKCNILCPICKKPINETNVKQNMDPERYAILKNERDTRELEYKKRIGNF